MYDSLPTRAPPLSVDCQDASTSCNRTYLNAPALTTSTMFVLTLSAWVDAPHAHHRESLLILYMNPAFADALAPASTRWISCGALGATVQHEHHHGDCMVRCNIIILGEKDSQTTWHMVVLVLGDEQLFNTSTTMAIASCAAT
jgi:hypothetical protein